MKRAIAAAILLLLAALGLRRWAAWLRQRAYEDAQGEATQERARFLQRLDHELKNPLTAMQIALANLERATDDAKREEITASVHSQLTRIRYLINDLRKLVTLGNGEIERIPVDMGNLLLETAQVFKDGEITLDRRFITDFAPHALPVLIGDRDLLQLAVYNLLDNAHKFSEPGDSITLHAHTDSDELVIQVVDTGRGIPETDLPHIWEDLYRSADVRGIPGSGLGLAMVRGIVEQHHGTVTAHSKAGDGTTMIVRLPIA